MNQAQKTATLIVRLVGLALLVAGVICLVHVLVVLVAGGDLSVVGERVVSAVVWTVVGVVLLMAARRIGQWLGRDLG